MNLSSTEFSFDPEKHEYRTVSGEKILGFSEIMKLCGMTDFDGVPPAILESARDFGIAVHKACEFEDNGLLDRKTLDPRIIPYLEAWNRFKSDFGLSVMFSEASMWSKKYRFATTLDRVMAKKKEIGDSEFWVVEIKSTATMPKTAPLQTRAHQEVFTETTHQKISKRCAVRLRPDGAYDVDFHKNPDDFLFFLSCLQVAQFKTKNKIGV